ncbi:MAG: hypothetical protein RIA63_06680 [Cyclobacteriaceae bacterium]
MKKKPAKSAAITKKIKNWKDKMVSKRPHEVKVIDKDFADIPANSKMLIATPKIIDDYVRQIPKGSSTTLQTMRKDLAITYQAEYTCPVTTGIFLRIVAEAAHEEFKSGIPTEKIAPFWRVVDDKSKLAKKVTFGASFIKQQRKKEGLDE